MEPKTTGKRVHIAMGSGLPKVVPAYALRKRIVSKDTYVAVQVLRTLIGVIGAGVWFVAGFFGLCALVGIFGILAAFRYGEGVGLIVGFVGVVIAGGIGYGLYRVGLIIFKEAVKTDPGIPFTRANTADLPAPNTLVRASEEPKQAQEAVLLRAAAQGQETPPEQMVRAVIGQG